uniref:Bifunctional inhibitor/plant lipid transfer protein/seed storage helical domain-containing protein n=1 Tax=Ananas comosus var. bracteatus TaxID=296719 RepID=A0A6V7NKW9_ANACO|nr:unnamed protein product [Ananas comosus var. bracteatus]
MVENDPRSKSNEIKERNETEKKKTKETHRDGLYKLFEKVCSGGGGGSGDVIRNRTSSGADKPAVRAGLVPCAIYLNSTNPPASCCNPLKNAFTNELPCACAVFHNPAILKGLGLDVTTGLALIRHCNITGVSPSLCSSAPTPATTPPTPTPGFRPNGANSLYGATWTGMSCTFSLLFMFLWFIVV